MKKIKSLLLLAVIFVISACSKDEFVDEGYLKVDYKIDLGFFSDLTINTDNNAYVLSTVGGTPEMKSLIKVNPSGTSTELYKRDADFFSWPKIANNSEGKIFMTNSDLQGKIYNFSDDFQQLSYHTMQGASQWNLRMDGFCSLPDDTFIILDNNSKLIKRYYPNLNTETVIAGSGSHQITDGTGLNSGFSWFSKAISFNNSVYIIDENYIRKIDCSVPSYPVSSPYILYYKDILDIAVDSNQDIYAIVNKEGIYKLSNGTITLFKNGVENIRTLNNNTLSAIDWTKFNRIYIKNNDMYLVSGYGTLTKISNFKNKL
ncbi:hypothetical protein [Flavobacterium koreense]